MKIIFTAVLFVLAFFCVQQVLVQTLVSPWLRPNLFIILIVFFNLLRGIRFSVLIAAFAGILMDSFAPRFGINTISFVLCAYLAGFLKMYIYQPGSVAARVLMVFLVVTANAFIQFIFAAVMMGTSLPSAMLAVVLPEIITTTAVSAYVFERLKRCALRLFA